MEGLPLYFRPKLGPDCRDHFREAKENIQVVGICVLHVWLVDLPEVRGVVQLYAASLHVV